MSDNLSHAMKVCPCWGSGENGPSECTAEQPCELHHLSDEQLKRILEASKPVPLMYLSGGIPMGGSQQENANSAWRSVAAELGCVWDSIRPARTGDEHDIEADPVTP